jgi:hypothetical protein
MNREIRQIWKYKTFTSWKQSGALPSLEFFRRCPDFPSKHVRGKKNVPKNSTPTALVSTCESVWILVLINGIQWYTFWKMHENTRKLVISLRLVFTRRRKIGGDTTDNERQREHRTRTVYPVLPSQTKSVPQNWPWQKTRQTFGEAGSKASVGILI